MSKNEEDMNKRKIVSWLGCILLMLCSCSEKYEANFVVKNSRKSEIMLCYGYGTLRPDTVRISPSSQSCLFSCDGMAEDKDFAFDYLYHGMSYCRLYVEDSLIAIWKSEDKREVGNFFNPDCWQKSCIRQKHGEYKTV